MNIEINHFFGDSRTSLTNYCYKKDGGKCYCLSLSDTIVNFWETPDHFYPKIHTIDGTNDLDAALTAYIETLDELRDSKDVTCIAYDEWRHIYKLPYDGEDWCFELTPYNLLTLDEKQVPGEFTPIDNFKGMNGDKRECYRLFLISLITKMQEVKKSLNKK